MVLLLGPLSSVSAQSNTSIQGEVTDQNGGVVSAAEIIVRSDAIGVERRSTTDSGGRFLIAGLPIDERKTQRSTISI